MSKLHIWGELDDLPSIDAECTAALAYLITFGDIDTSQIVKNYDPSLSPNGNFPALQIGDTWHAGFSAIRRYTDSKRAAQGTMLAAAQQADIDAWSCFIQQRGQALLDMYLYVSSNNYWEITSPAFTKILPWYANYIIPPARRSAATSRIKHLGIRSLDLDSIEEYAPGGDPRLGVQLNSSQSTFVGTQNNPEGLLKKQKSARWLRNQKHSDTFQLHQLTSAFFGPLEQLLGNKRYLLTKDHPSSLDCVAIGYLSLMLYAPVPQPWLADALKQRYPRLQKYAERAYEDTFMNPSKPWKPRISSPPVPSTIDGVKFIGRSVLDLSVPLLRKTVHSDSAVENSRYQVSQSPSPSSTWSNSLMSAMVLSAGAIAGLAFVVSKFMSAPASRQNTTFTAREDDYLRPARLSELGESGAILSALGQRLDFEAQMERERERTGGATLVEVDVESEKGEVGRDIIFEKR